VATYFSIAWGREAFRALTSPAAGLDDRTHWATAIYFRDLFDLGFVGLARIAHALGGVRFAVAGLCIAYLVVFLRGLIVEREPAPCVVDAMLMLATAGILIFAVPPVMAGDPGLIRLYTSQLLLVIGAAIVIMVERHGSQPAVEIDTAAIRSLAEYRSDARVLVRSFSD
jgi:hypothetical protein